MERGAERKTALLGNIEEAALVETNLAKLIMSRVDGVLPGIEAWESDRAREKESSRDRESESERDSNVETERTIETESEWDIRSSHGFP